MAVRTRPRSRPAFVLELEASPTDNVAIVFDAEDTGHPPRVPEASGRPVRARQTSVSEHPECYNRGATGEDPARQNETRRRGADHCALYACGATSRERRRHKQRRNRDMSTSRAGGCIEVIRARCQCRPRGRGRHRARVAPPPPSLLPAAVSAEAVAVRATRGRPGPRRRRARGSPPEVEQLG